MRAFDTDVLSDLFRGRPEVVARVGGIPAEEQFVPVVAAEEVVRGRLDAIVQAQTRPVRWTVEEAYQKFGEALLDLRRFHLLPYTPAAHQLVLRWRADKLRVGLRDLRIAATCVVHNITLATRNARDFALVPGLALDVWS